MIPHHHKHCRSSPRAPVLTLSTQRTSLTRHPTGNTSRAPNRMQPCPEWDNPPERGTTRKQHMCHHGRSHRQVYAHPPQPQRCIASHPATPTLSFVPRRRPEPPRQVALGSAHPG
jgi:hypothetical protein